MRALRKLLVLTVLLASAAVATSGITDPATHTTTFPTPPFVYTKVDGNCTWYHFLAPAAVDDQTDPGTHFDCLLFGLDTGYDQEKYAHAKSQNCYIWGYAWALDECTLSKTGTKAAVSNAGQFTLTQTGPPNCLVVMYGTFNPQMQTDVCNVIATGGAANGRASGTQTVRTTVLPAFGIPTNTAANVNAAGGCNPLTHNVTANQTHAVTSTETFYVTSTVDMAAFADCNPGSTCSSEAFLWDAIANLELKGVCMTAIYCNGTAKITH